MSLSVENSTDVKSEPVIVRPLGKMERSLWFCDQSSPTNIGLGCEIQGLVTEEGLRRALRWCQIRHPILRSVIRAKDKSLYLACYDIADAPPIPLAMCEGTPADEDAVTMEEMRVRLHGVDGLMVRARWLRLDHGRSFLNVVFNHVIGDGFSAVLLLQDIVNFLGKYARDGAVPDPTPLAFPPPSEQGIPKEHRGWSGIKKLFSVQKEMAADIKRHGAKPSAVRVQADPAYPERKIKCHNFRLSQPETRAFVARAKREQISTYALLASALLDALHPLLDSADVKKNGAGRVASFAAPVDMRPFLNHSVNGHFGFYSSAISQLCRLDENGDIAALAKQLHGDFRKSFVQKKVHLHTSPLLADFLSWRWLFPATDKGVARVAKLTEGMFKSCATSLTFLNDSLVIEDGHGMTVGRPRGHISPSIMGVALYCVLLYKDALTVHLNYNEGQLSDADAELLNARFRANLLSLGRTVED